MARNTDEQKRRRAEESLRIAEQAVDWLQRLPAADLKEREEFVAWLEEAGRNGLEVLIAKHCDTLLPHLFRMSPVDVNELLHGSSDVRSIDGWEPADSHAEATPRPAPSPLQRTKQVLSTMRKATWKIAATISFAALLTWLTIALQAGAEQTVLTSAGERHTVRLTDGTLVQTGARTEVEIELSDRARAVRLLRGEAMFHVSRDPIRPFLIETGDTVVRVVGTAFAVSRLDPSQAVITVKEGVVAVTRHGRSPAGEVRDLSVTLTAGEQVRVSSTLPLTVSRIDIDKELAWVDGWLLFDRETVAEAIPQFNLRNEMQLEVTDPKIAARAVRGTFEWSKPRDFAALLAKQGVAVVMTEDGNTLRLVPPLK